MSHPSLAELLDPSAEAVRVHLRRCDPCRALTGLAHEEPSAGALVDRSVYRELGVLAVGGMGRTSRAIDLRLGRVVAIKEMKQPETRLRARFEREAQLTARLQHPAIVSIYEAGRWRDPDGGRDGDPFYAMELVEGRTLDQEIAAARTLRERIALLPAVIRIVEAVAYAHEQHIVHRDIKPQNILIGRFGESVLIDWGLAKDLAAGEDADAPAGEAPFSSDEGSAALTEHGAGTAQYMSPQQAMGAPPLPSFDVYSLGATLYETLSGEPPYGKVKSSVVRARMMNGPPRPLGALAPDVPPELQAVVARAMARDPADGFRDAKELADELVRFQSGQLVTSHRYTPAELVRRFLRRPVVRTLAAAAILIVAVAAVLGARVLHERTQAVASVTRLYQEEGRQQLLSGSPLRALAWLGEARARGADSPALRYLWRAANRPLAAARITLSGHADSIDAAELSHDGQRLVTGSADQTARIWELQSGRVLAILRDHVSGVSRAHFSADDARVVTAGRDGLVKLWDAASGALLRTFDAGRPVTEAILGEDGAIVATTDELVLRWDASGVRRECRLGPTQRAARVSADGRRAIVIDTKGAVLLALPGCEPLAHSSDALWQDSLPGTFAPAGVQRFAFGKAKHALALVDLDAGDAMRVHSLEGHAEEVVSVAFSPDGKVLLSCSSDRTARAWDALTGAPIATFRGHTAQVNGADVSRDGRLLVTASGDGSARIWDLRSGEPLATLEGHGDLVSSARFSPDARAVLTVSRDGTARLWDVAAATALSPLPTHQDKLRAAVFSPDGQRALTAADDGQVMLHDLAQPARSRRLLGDKAPVRAAGFSPDGLRAFAVSADGSARVWTLTASEPSQLFRAGGPLGAGALSAAGRALAVGGPRGTASIFPLGGGAPLVLRGHRDEVTSLAFSPDGTLLATAAADGAARLFRTSSGELVAELSGHTDALRTVSFSPDGASLLTAGHDGTARLWSVAAPGAASRVLRHGGSVYSATFDAAGRRVLTAGADGAIHLWDAQTGEPLRSIDTGGVPITSAALSPDGALVASASDRETALWDLATQARLATVPVQNGSEGNSVSFRGDGQKALIALHDDGIALVWDLAPRAGELASPEAQLPWRVVDGALVRRRPAAPAEPQPEAAPAPGCQGDCFARGLAAELGRGRAQSHLAALELYLAGCAAGDARACARRHALQPDQLFDLVEDGDVAWLLFAVPASKVHLNGKYGAIARGAQVHVERYQGGVVRDLVLNRDPLPLVAPAAPGALGLDGQDALVFFTVKRRSETFENDGLLFRAHFPPQGAPTAERTVLFTEWNAGYKAFFDGKALHHYDYDDRDLALFAERVRPATEDEGRARVFRHQAERLGLRWDPALHWETWSALELPRLWAARLVQRTAALP